jgi:hypothetical protein
MPTVRLVNPHLFGSHQGRRGSSRGGKLSEKIGAIVRNSLQEEMHHLHRTAPEQVSGVESNPIVNHGGRTKGEQHFMARKHHHRKHHHRNPHVSRRRRHRNPIMAMSTPDLLKALAFAAGGNIVTDLVPNALGVGSGILGYAASVATALAGSFLAGKVAGPSAATSALIGGGLAVLRKVLNDFFPGTILSSGMSGDLSFYINNGFPVPTTGSGPYLLNSGFTGSQPQMNGGMPGPPQVAVSSNGQPIAAAPSLPAAADSAWRGSGRWSA